MRKKWVLRPDSHWLHLETTWNQREAAETPTGGVEDGIRNGRSDSHDGSLSCTGGWNVLSIQENHFNFGYIGEVRNAIAREAAIDDAPVIELDGFKERAAETLNHCSYNLVAQAVGIYDRAAFESFDETNDFNGT